MEYVVRPAGARGFGGGLGGFGGGPCLLSLPAGPPPAFPRPQEAAGTAERRAAPPPRDVGAISGGEARSRRPAFSLFLFALAPCCRRTGDGEGSTAAAFRPRGSPARPAPLRCVRAAAGGPCLRAAASASPRFLAKPRACSSSLTQLPVCVSWEDVGRWPSGEAPLGARGKYGLGLGSVPLWRLRPLSASPPAARRARGPRARRSTQDPAEPTRPLASRAQGAARPGRVPPAPRGRWFWRLPASFSFRGRSFSWGFARLRLPSALWGGLCGPWGGLYLLGPGGPWQTSCLCARAGIMRPASCPAGASWHHVRYLASASMPEVLIKSAPIPLSEQSPGCSQPCRLPGLLGSPPQLGPGDPCPSALPSGLPKGAAVPGGAPSPVPPSPPGPHQPPEPLQRRPAPLPPAGPCFLAPRPRASCLSLERPWEGHGAERLRGPGRGRSAQRDGWHGLLRDRGGGLGVGSGPRGVLVSGRPVQGDFPAPAWLHGGASGWEAGPEAAGAVLGPRGESPSLGLDSAEFGSVLGFAE